MSEKFSNQPTTIDYAKWRDDPQILVKLGGIVEDYIYADGLWEPMIGRANDRIIRTFSANNKSPVETLIILPSVGKGVRGNADVDTNFDHIEISAQTIYPDLVGNGFKSEVKKYEAANEVDFLKTATTQCKTFLKHKVDRAIFATLANDPTNVVLPDSAGSFKDLTAFADVKSAANTMTKADVLNVKTLRRAILMANVGMKYNAADLSKPSIMPFIQPRLTKTNVGGFNITMNSYVICLSTFAIEQLKRDPEWQDMQKHAGVRGDKNNLFTGLIGWIDNCPVVDMGSWSTFNAGMIHTAVSDDEYLESINELNYSTITKPSEFKGADCDLDFGFLLGANAIFGAGSDSTTIYVDDNADHGRKTVVSCDKLLTFAKAKIRKINTPALAQYAGNDLGVITIFSPHNI